MKVALVHDYLNEFGGAERVLEAFSEIWQSAPIYTAFYKEGSSAYERFRDREIITSWVQKVPFFGSKLHSPLRFLAPLIWNSFDFSSYDVVIDSSSWYITKGVLRGNPSTSLRLAALAQGRSGPQHTVEVCYCHTPPRYLYGYPTSVDWQKYWPVRVYALFINHFMRVYDFEAAQKVDYFIANSKEVQARIKKFYRRDSVVIYPPVDIKKFKVPDFVKTSTGRQSSKFKVAGEYFLVVSRLVASKNVDLAVEVCAKLNLPLKVVGTGRELGNLKGLVQKSNVKGKMSTVDFLGEVSDDKLIKLYQNCRAVIFPASQEDFGLVPVEAMAAGKPVIVNAEGGVLESVVDASAGSAQAGKGKGKCTGVYFGPATPGSLTLAINNFFDLEKKGVFDPAFIRKHAQKFSKERFKREIKQFIEGKVRR